MTEAMALAVKQSGCPCSPGRDGEFLGLPLSIFLNSIAKAGSAGASKPQIGLSQKHHKLRSIEQLQGFQGKWAAVVRVGNGSCKVVY